MFGFWWNNGGSGGGGGMPPDASETAKGIAEIATQAETQAGTDDARIVTPLKLEQKLSSLNKQGRTLFVSTDGDDATAVVGNIMFPYQNPQTALDDSLDGDTVIIFGGTYTGNITISDKNNVSLYCLGNVTINGDITYTVGGIPNKQINFIGNYSTVVNGSFFIANANGSFIFNVYGTNVNAGSNYAFFVDATKRAAFRVNDCNIISSYLCTAMGSNLDAVRPVGWFKRCTFTGISPFPEQFSDAIIDECEFNISGYFGVVRFDFNLTAQIKNSRINLTAIIDYLFLSSFNAGFYGFKLENVKITGTASRLVATQFNRFFNLDIRRCDFREFTATNGYINVTDTASYALWKVYIVDTFTSVGQLVYQTGSFTPPTVGNEFIDIIQF